MRNKIRFIYFKFKKIFTTEAGKSKLNVDNFKKNIKIKQII